jgi:hypothetical protein
MSICCPFKKIRQVFSCFSDSKPLLFPRLSLVSCCVVGWGMGGGRQWRSQAECVSWANTVTGHPPTGDSTLPSRKVPPSLLSLSPLSLSLSHSRLFSLSSSSLPLAPSRLFSLSSASSLPLPHSLRFKCFLHIDVNMIFLLSLFALTDSSLVLRVLHHLGCVIYTPCVCEDPSISIDLQIRL